VPSFPIFEKFRACGASCWGHYYYYFALEIHYYYYLHSQNRYYYYIITGARAHIFHVIITWAFYITSHNISTPCIGRGVIGGHAGLARACCFSQAVAFIAHVQVISALIDVRERADSLMVLIEYRERG